MPTHIPLALPACLPTSWALPLPGASEVEGGHLGMGGGDSRVWTPPRVAQGQENRAHHYLLGSRLGAQARAEDAWVLRPGWGWGHGKRWSCLYRGEGGSGWRAADKSSFVPGSGAGRVQRDAPPSGSPLHPCLPLNSTSALRDSFVRAPFPQSAPLHLRGHLESREVYSPFHRSPKEPRPLCPYFRIFFYSLCHCVQLLGPFL